ncbi:MAG: signal peptidase I [Lachnospiraceae bacterium]|nr:signal peptidase I [Lachnospiraceae bacterium]
MNTQDTLKAGAGTVLLNGHVPGEDPEEAETPEKKKSKTSGIIKDLIEIALIILAAFLFVKFIAVRSVVDGDSMNPMLHDGDNLMLEKVSYYFHGPERFDIIVFELKDDPGTHYIKRVIGLPGETVQIIDGYVYINDEKLDSDVYGNEIIKEAYLARRPITLGEDEYFVMGDNRNNSTDSRLKSCGNVMKSQIVGKAFVRFWPFSAFGLLSHGES